ncbi:MAG TPA: NADH-quinone oxidoreductase subunit NuoB [Jiangellales bacterium]|nr:NADH-quinone oxidoreductase subunit NuoB [Jiangellales bacterium]
MEEHPQGGFHGLLEVIPTKADYVLDLIRANSLWPLLSGLSCCAIEMMSTATSVNDIDRFGMFPFRASPRQADVLIVAGTLTTKMAGPLVRLWEQMPEPKWCVAMGTCTTSGGRFKRSYSVVQGVDRVMPVDVYVPGCPPRPEALLQGILKLQDKIAAEHLGERYVANATGGPAADRRELPTSALTRPVVRQGAPPGGRSG